MYVVLYKADLQVNDFLRLRNRIEIEEEEQTNFNLKMLTYSLIARKATTRQRQPGQKAGAGGPTGTKSKKKRFTL